MSPIVVRSPTRVDLAGGTLDLWPLYNFIDQAFTVNVAIDVYTKVILSPESHSRIRILSKDLGCDREFEDIKALLLDPDPDLQLFKPVLKFWNPSQGFSLETMSQSPVGGGLGGSSSLLVSLMKAFSLWRKTPLNNPSQLAHICHNLEAKVLNTPTGTQDYYPAISGGLNILRYNSEGITQKVLPVLGTPFEGSFLLVYTGKAHHSGINNFEVVKAAVEGDKGTLKGLSDLGQISEEMAQACQKQEWNRLPSLFNREYTSRVKLSASFVSPEIEKLQDISMQAGALAVKICGAGGGGCVLVWSDPIQRERIRKLCQDAGFLVMDSRPVDPF